MPGQTISQLEICARPACSVGRVCSFLSGGNSCCGCNHSSHGFYVEPREEDGRPPAVAFKVFWLSSSKNERQQAVLSPQAISRWSSLVRAANRFRVRVKIAVAEQVHAQLKPHAPFVQSDEPSTYIVGPFPFEYLLLGHGKRGPLNRSLVVLTTRALGSAGGAITWI